MCVRVCVYVCVCVCVSARVHAECNISNVDEHACFEAYLGDVLYQVSKHSCTSSDSSVGTRVKQKLSSMSPSSSKQRCT